MIENITNIAPVDTGLSVVHQLLSFSYWALGGAIGIAILTVLFNLYYKSKHLMALNKIIEQNAEIIKVLKKKK